MTSLPDFRNSSYQVEQELGCNRLGGRFTYLARDSQQQPVVLKQFRFGSSEASWAGFRAYESEIAVLQQLNHPGIPRYLDSFATADGFCMVQEYKAAPSLAEPRAWSPQDVQRVAVALLKILVYLQDRPQPVIHRDIKPENVLADADSNVYLIDFGFARLGGSDLAASTVIKGTLGFMPPEQLFNRALTRASDLYSAGLTLICLLTGTRSTAVEGLIDDHYRLHFRELMPPLPQGWLAWLERLVEPQLESRVADAAAALAALESVELQRLPRPRLEVTALELVATRSDELVRQAVTVTNSIPDTQLVGRWEVVPHDSDPSSAADDHPWIQFAPTYFEGNQVSCELRVDTSYLRSGQRFQRRVRLRSNGIPETVELDLCVQTAGAPELPARLLAIALPLSFATGAIAILLDQLFFNLVLLLPALVGFDASLTTAANRTKLADSNPSALFMRFAFGSFSSQMLGLLAGISVALFVSLMAGRFLVSSWDAWTPNIMITTIAVGWLWGLTRTRSNIGFWWGGCLCVLSLSLVLASVGFMLFLIELQASDIVTGAPRFLLVLFPWSLVALGQLEAKHLRSALTRAGNARAWLMLPTWVISFGFGSGAWIVTLYEIAKYRLLDVNTVLFLSAVALPLALLGIATARRFTRLLRQQRRYQRSLPQRISA